MDAHRRLGLPLLQWHALILFIVASLCINSCYSSSANSLRAVSEEEKVSLDFYYESLCPYCSKFIVEHLYKIFDNGIIDITNLKFIPYGNAHIRPNGTIVCQHGQYECFLNTVEACAIAVWPDLKEHFPYIYCVESLIYHGEYTQWETCFEKLGLDRKPIDQCYESGQGTRIELGYAAQTNSLQPPHRYVPWVVVDGQPLYDDYRDFETFICKAYKGTAVPSVCNEKLAGVVNQKEKRNSINPVCYSGVTIKSMFSRIRSVLSSWMQGVTMAALA